MAEVVKQGTGEGWVERVPEGMFRFAWYQTMQWSDGQERILERGVDYPSWMSFTELSRRLKRNAGRQQGQAYLWQDEEDGRVHLVMTRDQRFEPRFMPEGGVG